MQCLSSNWSDLPKDILIQILECLNARVYHVLLRSVCQGWRTSLQLILAGSESPHLPFQNLKIPIFPTLIGNARITSIPPHDSISEKIFFHLSPIDSTTPGWIIQVEEVGPSKWSFFNPLTGIKLHFPRGALPSSINFLDYRITELGRSLSLRFVDRVSQARWTPLRKVICSSSSESVVFLALSNSGKLYYYKPGFAEWVSDFIIWDMLFQDIISYNGRFYAVDGKGRLLIIDLECEAVVLVVSPVIDKAIDPFVGSEKSFYLIVSEGSFYLLVRDRFAEGYRYRRKTFIEFYSLRMEGRRGKWIRVRALTGGRVLFVGGESGDAYFASSSAILGSKFKNCVYLGGYTGICKAADVEFGAFPGVYDVNHNRIVRFVHWPDQSANTRLFWPPPSWIVPNVDQYEWFVGKKTQYHESHYSHPLVCSTSYLGGFL